MIVFSVWTCLECKPGAGRIFSIQGLNTTLGLDNRQEHRPHSSILTITCISSEKDSPNLSARVFIVILLYSSPPAKYFFLHMPSDLNPADTAKALI